MLVVSLLRAAAAPSALRAVSKVSTNGRATVQKLSTHARIASWPQQRRSLFVSASAQATAASSSAVKKAAKPKKPVKKVAAKPKAPKKKVEPKLKPWEKRGPDGKLVPLPRATKPKRTNPFALFMQQRTKELRGDSSVMNNATGKFDVTRMAAKVASEWKSLSDAEKQEYSKEAERSSAEYERELERWRNSLTSEDIRRENAYISAQRKKGKQGTALLRDPTKPKHPVSAFFAYYASVRQSEPPSGSLSIAEQSKQVAANWRNLSPQEKAPYEREAAVDRERYQKEIEKWKLNAAQ